MQCVRCGAIFEGRFCPRCGAPATIPAPSASAPTPLAGWTCPRCGTLFLGNFCPRCGLPTAAWGYPPRPAPSSVRPVLTILWTLAIVAFLIFAVTDFAGLAVSPTLIIPGIQGIQSGQTVNGDLNFDLNWTPNSWGGGSALSYENTGGNPGGYLRTTLFGSGARGFWMQAFRVDGSTPFTGAVRLDVEISGGLTLGYLFVSVDSSPSDPDPNTAIAEVRFTGPMSWTITDRFFLDARLTDPGLYYLKIAFVANVTSGPVDVGFDNIRLSWATAAAVVLYVPIPAPYPLLVSRDKTLFLAYYGLIVAALFAIGAFHAIRERREFWNAVRAPIDAIGTRLRARSAWIAVGQVWMAVTFFQVAVIFLLSLADIETTTPISIDSRNVWVLLFELANAGVYEEIAFRLLLIGVPMALGSAVLRIMEVNRGASGRLPGSAGRYIAGAWRYLVGGAIRHDSPKEAHVAAWAFLFASSAIFGLAHLPGWGWWKVAPSMVAGLGFGYLFLRHGIGAAILAHFVNDYILALSLEGVGGPALEAIISLMFLGLAIAGAGFLAWYAIDGWRHLIRLIAQFRPPTRAPSTRPPPVPYVSPPPTSYAAPIPPPAATPSSSAPSRIPEGWSPGPAVGPPAAPFRDSGRIPRDYTPTYVAPPYGFPPVRFQCPSCGWVEARYDAGRFTCTRCGRAA